MVGDQRVLVLSEVGVLRAQLVEVDVLLLPSRRLDVLLLLVDRQAQHLVEVRDLLEGPRLDQMEHDSVFQLQCQLVAVRLVLATAQLLTRLDLRTDSISLDDVVQGNRVVPVQHLRLDAVDVLVKYGAC